LIGDDHANEHGALHATVSTVRDKPGGTVVMTVPVLTVALQLAVVCWLALSVTVRLAVDVPAVEDENRICCPDPETAPDHEYVYGGVPPLGLALNTTLCDTAAGLGEAEHVAESDPLVTYRYAGLLECDTVMLFTVLNALKVIVAGPVAAVDVRVIGKETWTGLEPLKVIPGMPVVVVLLGSPL